mmetsp:Transcript_34273/g.101825  ORF Transcript_34273/g.101825 Transcript_34273/m.101825 type:complete len:282 (-) Transcript_34273:763-1608(-)
MVSADLDEGADNLPLGGRAIREFAGLDRQELAVEGAVIKSLLAALPQEVQPDELADADPLEVGGEASSEAPLGLLLLALLERLPGLLRVVGVQLLPPPGGEVGGAGLRGCGRRGRRPAGPGGLPPEGGRRRDRKRQRFLVHDLDPDVQDHVIDGVVGPVGRARWRASHVDVARAGVRRARGRVVGHFGPHVHGAGRRTPPLRDRRLDWVEEAWKTRVLRRDRRVCQRQDVAWDEPGGVELLAEEVPLADVEGAVVHPSELLAGLHPLQAVLHREGSASPRS